MAVFALIHSPLVGPTTWSPAAAALQTRAIVPVLSDGGDGPYWRRHADSAAKAIRAHAFGKVVLVGHSGAGPLLPAIADRLPGLVAGFIFVDAGIPKDWFSRIALMGEEDAAFAVKFGEYLNGGGLYPNWTDDDLAALVPDAELRRRLHAEMRPRDLAFFSEAIGVPAGWPRAPCGYVRLSAAYDKPLAEAQARGWPWRKVEARHFHMMVEPGATAAMLNELAAEMGVA